MALTPAEDQRNAEEYPLHRLPDAMALAHKYAAFMAIFERETLYVRKLAGVVFTGVARESLSEDLLSRIAGMPK